MTNRKTQKLGIKQLQRKQQKQQEQQEQLQKQLEAAKSQGREWVSKFLLEIIDDTKAGDKRRATGNYAEVVSAIAEARYCIPTAERTAEPTAEGDVFTAASLPHGVVVGISRCLGHSGEWEDVIGNMDLVKGKLEELRKRFPPDGEHSLDFFRHLYRGVKGSKPRAADRPKQEDLGVAEQAGVGRSHRAGVDPSTREALRKAGACKLFFQELGNVLFQPEGHSDLKPERRSHSPAPFHEDTSAPPLIAHVQPPAASYSASSTLSEHSLTPRKRTHSGTFRPKAEDMGTQLSTPHRALSPPPDATIPSTESSQHVPAPPQA